ncbi:hypothetical protein SNEBB_006376 [Seison nebaliae]|nr:hypothetical protein SNEBB_006376 [Seison nebaliae]
MYFSRALSKAEANYSVIHRELLAIVYALQRTKQYVLGFEVKLMSDHKPLSYILQKGDPTGKIARWLIFLQQFNLSINYVEGKNNHCADFLSRSCITDSTEPLAHEVLGGVYVNTVEKDIEWSHEDLLTAQTRDNYVNSIIDYLKLKKKPACKKFKIVDNMLYRRIKNRDEKSLTVVLPHDYVEKALQLSHDHNLSAHPGIRGTMNRLKQKFFIPRLDVIVSKYVKSCNVCNSTKPKAVPLAPLEKWPIGSKMSRFHLDLIGPMSESITGKKYILTAIDATTRFTELIALETKSANEVAKAIFENIVLRYGPMSVIYTDMGTEFVNSVLSELTSLLGITKKCVTAYHPSSNGLVEAANKKVVQAIRTLTVDKPLEWSEMIPFVRYSLNTAYHPAVKDTPHYLMYLQDPRVPVELVAQNERRYYDIDNYRTEFLQKAQLAYKRVGQALENRHDELVAIRGKTAKRRHFLIGDRVWLKHITTPEVSKKLQRKFDGPYRIVKIFSPIIVEIESIASKKRIKTHIDRLFLEQNADKDELENSDMQKAFLSDKAAGAESVHDETFRLCDVSTQTTDGQSEEKFDESKSKVAPSAEKNASEHRRTDSIDQLSTLTRFNSANSRTTGAGSAAENVANVREEMADKSANTVSQANSDEFESDTLSNSYEFSSDEDNVTCVQSRTDTSQPVYDREVITERVNEEVEQLPKLPDSTSESSQSEESLPPGYRLSDSDISMGSKISTPTEGVNDTPIISTPTVNELRNWNPKAMSTPHRKTVFYKPYEKPQKGNVETHKHALRSRGQVEKLPWVLRKQI